MTTIKIILIHDQSVVDKINISICKIDTRNYFMQLGYDPQKFDYKPKFMISKLFCFKQEILRYFPDS